MMDLGATICTPKRPNCLICPWLRPVRHAETASPKPCRAAPPKSPNRSDGLVYWLENAKGEVLMARAALIRACWAVCWPFLNRLGRRQRQRPADKTAARLDCPARRSGACVHPFPPDFARDRPKPRCMAFANRPVINGSARAISPTKLCPASCERWR